MILASFVLLGLMMFLLTQKESIPSIFTLAAIFISVAILFALFKSPMLAALQIVIYVGGVLVLMVFGTMVSKNAEKFEHQNVLISICVGLVLFGLISKNMLYLKINPIAQSIVPKSTLGQAFVGPYMFGFEWLGLVLLVVLVVSTYIAKP